MDRNKVIEAAARLVATGAYDEAIREYQRILDVHPKDVRVLQKMGELFQKRNDVVQATEYFTRVAERYASDGFFLKAVALYKQVLELDPSLIHVNLKLAELHDQLMLWVEAMAYFQAAATQYERAGDTHASLSALTRLDTLKKKLDEEREIIASRVKPAEQRARELAAVYLSQGDPKRALAELQVCFKADPRDVDTLRLLAQAFQGLDQIAGAVSIYKELARVQQERGRRGEAEQMWKQVERLDPHDSDVAQRRPASGLATAAPPRAAATESQALQHRINLVSGVKALKANGFRSVAPLPWRQVSPAGLGELLTRRHLISPAELNRATEARLSGESLETALIRTGTIKESTWLDFLSKHYEVPSIDLELFDVASDVRALIPERLWVAWCVFPVAVMGPCLIVAMRDPSDLSALDDLRFLTGRSIEPVVSSEPGIRRTIKKYGRAPRAFLN